ncbi:MAG: exodeoxyribonuclease VII large subunit [Candidatus Eisenbacteria bacterium]|nr:exodeoxyribonuclease VII large subunit [Candidatus Eisenbacteria bacterium]
MSLQNHSQAFAEEKGPVCLSVKAATALIKSCIEQGIGPLWVEGEICNFVAHSSGHFYFSVKDPEAQLRCVMFRGANSRLRFRPKDGMQCMLFGRVTVYERSGQYQLIVERLDPVGEGRRQAALLALKERLQGEGLFDAARKRKLPAMPRTIGIVTSPTGAAIRDLQRVLSRRWPPIRIILRPTVVQGVDAPGDIVAGIEALALRTDIDLLIVGRGGGSSDDLWAFNEEIVVRAIAASPTPVISAVGHEIDFTLADLAADLRAPTPSAAAELAVPEVREVLGVARSNLSRCARAVGRKMHEARLRLEGIARGRALQNPLDRIRQLAQRADELMARARQSAMNLERAERARLAGVIARIQALHPAAVLERGFAIAFDEGGDLVTRAGSLSQGACVRLVLREGVLRCRVEEEEDAASIDALLGREAPCADDAAEERQEHSAE